MAFITRDTELGFELPQVANQMRLERWIQREALQQKADPGLHSAENIHTDVEVAQKEGLKAPVAGGPFMMSHISRIMLMAFGEGWLKGGKATLKLIKPVYPDDFVMAKGFVKEKTLDEGHVRVVCEVWVENQRHEKVVVGTASGLVA